MSTAAAPITRPQPNRMYGVTHALDGAPIVVEPKILKVGIGLPKGPAINVYRAGGKWQIQVGFKGKACPAGPQAQSYDTLEQTRAAYKQLKAKAPDCPFPRKVGYFTFTRQAADGTFEPDWKAIDEHGELPTEIDIMFLSDSPLDASYQMWSTAELRCRGDGLNAERVLSMAKEHDKDLADAARLAGDRYFPIVEACWIRGCKYAGAEGGCKPSGDLKFQLVNSLRIGGTAYFHTTGFRSIRNLHSCIQIIKAFTAPVDPDTGMKDIERGRIAGIPLKLVVRPYHAKHEGKVSTQYGVAIEVREETLEALARKLLGQARRFQELMSGGAERPGPPQVAAGAPLEIAAPAAAAAAVPEEIQSDEDEEARAQAITDEFHGEDEPGETGWQFDPPAAAAAATAGPVPKPSANRRRAAKPQQQAAAPQPAPDVMFEFWIWVPGKGLVAANEPPQVEQQLAELRAQAIANSIGQECQVMRVEGDSRPIVFTARPPAKPSVDPAPTAPKPTADPAPTFEIHAYMAGEWALTPDKPADEYAAGLRAQARANETGLAHRVVRVVGNNRVGLASYKQQTAPEEDLPF